MERCLLSWITALNKVTAGQVVAIDGKALAAATTRPPASRPPTQSAREASRRTQCLNNLRQHGIALASYVTSADAYPIGYIAWRNPPGGAAPGWAWAAALLPQLEQGPLYQALNVNLPIDVPANASPSSFCGPHAGLTHFLMVDSSARPTKATIDPRVYRALATRNGREVIDQGAY